MPKTGGAFSLPHAAVFKMKLILMRHTQAEWGFGLEDHERASAPKAKLRQHRLGIWLTDNDIQPSHALISDAKRTQQTFAASQSNLRGGAVCLISIWRHPKALLLARQTLRRIAYWF